MHKINSVWLL